MRAVLTVLLLGCGSDPVKTMQPDAMPIDAAIDSPSIDGAMIDAGIDATIDAMACNQTSGNQICCGPDSSGETQWCQSGICRRCGLIAQDCCPTQCAGVPRCSDPYVCLEISTGPPPVLQCGSCGTRGTACCPPIGQFSCTALPCRCLDGSVCMGQGQGFICQ